MGGETDQYHPDLVARQPPGRPAAHAGGGVPPHRGPGRQGHPVPEGPARRRRPTKPFFLWFTPGACHAPHQAPRRVHRPLPRAVRPGLGRVARRGVRAADRRRVCCPPGTELSERPSWVPAVGLVDAPTSNGSYARMMEVFAGFLTHTDAQVARRARLHRPSSASSTTRSCMRDERQRRVGRGRCEGLVQRAVLLQLRAREPRGEPRAASTSSARPRPTTTTRGAGRGRATRRSSGSSATRTKVAWPIR